MTRTLEKNNLYEAIGDNDNYNLSSGVAFLIDLTTNVPVNSDLVASVLAHEFFVHVQKDISRISTAPQYPVGSTQYKRILNCIKNSANSDHGQFARGEVTLFRDISNSFDQLLSTNIYSKLYQEDVIRHSSLKNEGVCN